MKIVVDSYAWVELFSGSNKGRIVKEKLSEASEVYTPDVVVTELARKYRKDNVDVETIRARLSKISEISKIVSITEDIAIKASELDLELRKRAKESKLKEPSLFDAIVLATAKTLNASVITGDEHFRERTEAIWVGE
ncbi:MAG: PIN domain-containing protein [Thermoproteota archaeon]